MTPHSDKDKKLKCVKASHKDPSLCFGDGVEKWDIVDITNKVLVGRVRGIVYIVACLHLWVMEIWGNILKELSTITTLARGWFSLRFKREDYTSWVILWY